MTAKRTFPVEWLERHHIAVAGMSELVVHRQFGEHQEYGSTWTVVFMDDGRYWEATYQDANTSEVHVDTWFDEELVTATEVVPRGTFVTQWVPKKWDTAGVCTAEADGVCGQAAPFLVAIRSGETGIQTLERCERHTRMLVLSADDFERIQEVRRRWH